MNKGLEVVIREELDADQWKRYEIFQDTLGGRPYLFNGGLRPVAPMALARRALIIRFRQKPDG